MKDWSDNVNLSLPLLIIAEYVFINGIFLPDVSHIFTIGQVQMTLTTSHKTEIIRQPLLSHHSQGTSLSYLRSV